LLIVSKMPDCVAAPRVIMRGQSGLIFTKARHPGGGGFALGRPTLFIVITPTSVMELISWIFFYHNWSIIISMSEKHDNGKQIRLTSLSSCAG